MVLRLVTAHSAAAQCGILLWLHRRPCAVFDGLAHALPDDENVMRTGYECDEREREKNKVD